MFLDFSLFLQLVLTVYIFTTWGPPHMCDLKALFTVIITVDLQYMHTYTLVPSQTRMHTQEHTFMPTHTAEPVKYRLNSSNIEDPCWSSLLELPGDVATTHLLHPGS